MPVFGTAITLDEFKERVEARAKFYHDEMIHASQLRMSAESGNIDRVDQEKDPEGKEALKVLSYPMTTQGFSTFCQKLGIPALYAKRCPVDLRAANFNYWLGKKGGKELFVRFDKYPDDADKIRAVLSDRYADFPNTELAKMLLEKANPKYSFKISYQEQESNLIGELIALAAEFGDEDFQGGIHVRNSEVGLSKLTLEALLYSKALDSGIILREMVGFSEKHIGEKKEFSKSFGEAIDRIMSGLSVTMKNMADLKTIAVGDVPDIIRVICDTNLVKGEQRAALDRAQVVLEAKTLFDVVCIFMRAATDSELTLVEREELQRVGGDIVTKAKRYQRWL